MRQSAVARFLAIVSFASLGSQGVLVESALAAKKKAPAKAASAKPAGPAPTASAEEIEKLKGDYKWGMSTDQVAAELTKRIEASYADKLKATVNDPTRQGSVRKMMAADIADLKKKYTKFDGQKTGYDVSIIDQEFAHKTNESMMTAKEENGTRYFFFADGKLYKMFVAFDKDILQGKSFAEFGQLMQGRFGKAKDVYVEEKSKAGVARKLDHFEWSSKAGDGLRLVDRSEFYDVFCLVVYDAGVARRLEDARKIANPSYEKKDALVEAVINTKQSENDVNDDIVDRIVGKEAKRPGDERAPDVVVPSTTGKAPTPAEVNRKAPASTSSGAGTSDRKAPPPKGGLEL